jgi:large subunit ribosomal protein L21
MNGKRWSLQMYAVILSGGKQYRVQKGDTLKLESLPEEVGSTVNFDQVLLVGEGDKIKVGSPYIKGGKVSATVLSQGRHKKIHIVKFRRRKHHEKWQGHRQNFTEVQITNIVA